MGRWRAHTANWLSSEQHDPDAAADAAFAQVFAAVPPVEPSADFVRRAVDAAWLARARRRRTVALASLAASVLPAAAAGVTAYSVFGVAGGWLVTTTAGAVTSALVSLSATAPTAVSWWLATAHAGSTVADIVIMPQGAAALVGIELVGAAALYMLQRLLQADLRFRGPGPLCV
jgi:hypothetical protein